MDERENSLGELDRHGSVISSRPLPLRVQRPPPWNRWFFKTIHYWRYGYSHPDEDLLPVIDAVGDALNVYIISARAEFPGAQTREAGRIKADLDAELKKALPDFSSLLGIEARINALYPPALAKRRQWVVRERFERVASPGAFQSWRVAQMATQLEQAPVAPKESVPEPKPEIAQPKPETPAPEPAPGAEPVDAAGMETATGPETPGEQAEPTPKAQSGGAEAGDGEGGDGGAAGGGAGGSGGENGKGEDGAPGAACPKEELSPDKDDTQTLLGYIHSNYLLTIAREKAVRDLKRWLLMRFWFFLLLTILTLAVSGGVLLVLQAERYWGLLLGLFLVATAGRIGATTSVIRRLQAAVSGNVLARDPIIELTALRTGKNEISLALLTSSIFALLMYAFFMSGVPAMLGFQQGIFPQPSRAALSVQQAQTPAASQLQGAESEKPDEGSSVADTETNAADADTNTAAAESEGAEPGAEPEAGANMAAAETNMATAETNMATADTDTATAETNTVAAEPGASKRERKLDIACRTGVDCDPFDDLAHRLGLEGAVDFFKLILWAFIAGFGERFVPDVLDRVVTRGRGRSGGDADAEAALAAHASARTATTVSTATTQSARPPPGTAAGAIRADGAWGWGFRLPS